MTDIAALILAAGRSTRFGTADETKALALWRGKPLLQWVAEAALGSRATPVVAVTGHAAEAVKPVLASLAVRCIDNPGYGEGMAGSLQAGIAALSDGADGAVVLLADMPLVTAAIIDRLVARFEEDGAVADAVVPVRRGRQGNPVLLGRAIFSGVAALSGDEGARRLLARGDRRVLTCPIDDEAIEVDVDTAAALAALS